MALFSDDIWKNTDHENSDKNTEYIKLFKQIIESLHDGIFIADPLGKVLYINQSSEKLCGIKKEDVIGKNVLDLEKQGLFYPSVIGMAIKGKGPASIIQNTFENKKLLAKAMPLYNKDGILSYFLAVTCDVTELLNLKQSLEEKDETIKQFLLKIKNLEVDSKLDYQSGILFASDKMEKINSTLQRVAKSDINILLLGESGVGKTMISKLIHHNSNRKDQSFQVINCSIIPEALLESELFGYEKGSFTGALDSGKKGLFELANGGTIFLDEIGELTFPMQAKLLQVIQEKKIRRIGGTTEINVDFRLIAATNQDLAVNITNKTFREDLYYRLNGFSLFIPPLRERRDDIQALSLFFLDRQNKKYETKKKLSKDVLQIFNHFSWPGNIRELEHVIESLCVVSEYDMITPEDLPECFDQIKQSMEFPKISPDVIMPIGKAFEMVEAELIRRAYARYGNTYKVAEVLGISQSTAFRKIKKYILKG